MAGLDPTLTEVSVMGITNRHRLRHRPILSSSSLPQLWLCGSRRAGGRVSARAINKCGLAPWDLATSKSSQPGGHEVPRGSSLRRGPPNRRPLCALGRVFSGRYCWTKTLLTEWLGETKSRSLKPRLTAVSWRTVRPALDAEWFGSDGCLFYQFSLHTVLKLSINVLNLGNGSDPAPLCDSHGVIGPLWTPIRWASTQFLGARAPTRELFRDSSRLDAQREF